MLNHQVHGLSAKVIREPLFPWVQWGAKGEVDSVKAQKRVWRNEMKIEREKQRKKSKIGIAGAKREGKTKT